ncbi:hypothetical protein ERR94_25400, partial [Salmonella enterica]|nr:hypothetical protein [Salmonella enterica]
MKKQSVFSGNILTVFYNYILIAQKTKGLSFGNPLFNLAEAQRFELWNPFGSPVFKTKKNNNKNQL